MQKFVNVRSTATNVLPLEIDEYHVYVNTGIEEINEPADEKTGEGGFIGFEIEEQKVYEKDEYIILSSQESTEVAETVNSILTEIIPSLMGE
ncbi:hypothetical protein LJC58_02060 [Lachnospiraceae bacterium OttesenSCG-928-D06]|nr:hypothetical protein [Lachnospiraceae bacterium OttesenSCG-928-D06]